MINLKFNNLKAKVQCPKCNDIIPQHRFDKHQCFSKKANKLLIGFILITIVLLIIWLVTFIHYTKT